MAPPAHEVHHLAMEKVICLVRAGEVIASLRVTETDFPFINCSLEATEAFEALRPLFEARLQAQRRRDYPAADVMQAELAAAELSVQSVDGRVVVRHFLLNIYGDTAHLRSWPEGLTFSAFHAQAAGGQPAG